MNFFELLQNGRFLEKVQGVRGCAQSILLDICDCELTEDSSVANFGEDQAVQSLVAKSSVAKRQLHFLRRGDDNCHSAPELVHRYRIGVSSCYRSITLMRFPAMFST